MDKAQTIADLAFELAAITSIDRTQEILRRAVRAAGLSYTQTIDAAGLQALLEAIAAEGGVVQQLAEQIAAQPGGIGGTVGRMPPSGQDAA